MDSVRIIGPGRAGSALAAALSAAGWRVDDLLGRGHDLAGAASGVDAVVIAVPDRSIAEVARSVTPVAGTVVVHLAGSLGIDALAPHPRRGALHPLVSIPNAVIGAQRLQGAWFAVAGDPAVEAMVEAVQGRSFAVADADRAAYHATACVAANHLVALLGQVERLAAAARVPFQPFVELATGCLDNVARIGPAAALTGPASRGDEVTIARHLAALAEAERSTYLCLVAEARRLARERDERVRP